MAPLLTKRDAHECLKSCNRICLTLAENGPDAIYNTVAICPNCHRRIHVLHQKEDVNKLSKVIMKYLLNDEDKENIKKWEELFKN